MTRGVNLLLPINSALETEEGFIDVTTLRIRRISAKKKFRIQLFNKDKLVKEIMLSSMSLRLKTFESILILEIADEKKVVISVQGAKFLTDEALKGYINTLAM